MYSEAVHRITLLRQQSLYISSVPLLRIARAECTVLSAQKWKMVTVLRKCGKESEK